MAAVAQAPKKQNFIVRFFTMNTSREVGGRKLPLWRQLLLQLLCIFVAITVLFPIMYVVTLSLSSSPFRPISLQLIPREFSLTAFQQVLEHPTANPVSFARLLFNSLRLSITVGLIAVLVAVSAAYAFSRFKFRFRQVLMIMVFIPLLMPAIGLATPLFLLMNSIRVAECPDGSTAISPFTECAEGERGKLTFNLRDSLIGNLKGYLDTIPKELEEAAKIDGANENQVFFRIVLPLAVPQLAVTFFLGFIGFWQEFAMPWLFLTAPENYTLSMTLYNMTGQYATSIPWNQFAAFAIIVALPVAIIYIPLQKYITSGLTAGAIKG
jgi:arabinogalactan oligomer/maltooligosaccharide transport system permease protein